MRPLPFICVIVFALAAAGPASAQIDLSGSWQAVFHEDQPERVPGPIRCRHTLGPREEDSAERHQRQSEYDL